MAKVSRVFHLFATAFAFIYNKQQIILEKTPSLIRSIRSSSPNYVSELFYGIYVPSLRKGTHRPVFGRDPMACVQHTDAFRPELRFRNVRHSMVAGGGRYSYGNTFVLCYKKVQAENGAYRERMRVKIL